MTFTPAAIVIVDFLVRAVRRVVQGVCVAALPSVLLAQRTPAPSDEKWVRESWTVRDGLPVNSINALVQSRDGYIWAATFDGLVRYDGVRFTVFNTANTPGLPSNRILHIREAGDGSLWMQTEQFNLVRFAGDRASVITADDPADVRVRRFTFAADGSLWVGTDRGIGVVRGTQVVPVARAAIDTPVGALHAAPDGTVYVMSVDGRVWRVTANGTARPIPFGGTLPPWAYEYEAPPMYVDASSVLTVSAYGQFWMGRDTLRPVTIGLRATGTMSIERSRATGALWLYGTNDIVRQTASATDLVLTHARRTPTAATWNDAAGFWFAAENRVYRDGQLVHTLDLTSFSLEPIEITAVLVDREGSVWVGTRSAGLHRLTKSLFRAVGAPEGVAGNNIYPIVETPDGAVWLGTWGNGVSRVDPVTQRVTSFLAGQLIQSLIGDGDGRLLVAPSRGLYECVMAPVFRCVVASDSTVQNASIYALYRAPDGALLAGTNRGVMRRASGQWSVLPGSPAAPMRAAARTPDGAIWMATNGSGLARWHDGRFVYVTTADGLPTNVIRSLYVDVDGWLWVGTEGRGLVRLDPRQWTTPRARGDSSRRIVHIGTVEGLYDEVVHQILEDDAGQLWMSSNRGIFRVARAELLAFADGRATRVSSLAYTERDGLRNREANGGYFPAGTRARDGRLWFPTQAGAVVVDPRRVERTAVAPPVVIERVVTRDRQIVAQPSLALGATERDLEIQYTAPSFFEPSNLRFRYRLVPYDAEWVDAATRRTAFYTQVPAGAYTFAVQVSDGRGGWHDTTAQLAVTIGPRWYETWLARLLGAALLIAGVMSAVRVRSRRLRERADELERLVDVRTAELRENQRELAARNTQLGEQASALAELSGARSRMFANLSHEFRTPLTLILGPLQSLLEGRHGAVPDAVTVQHSLMRRNAQRLLRLINQILDLARLQGGGMTLDRKVQDLVPFLEGLIQVFADLAERRGVILRLESTDPSLTFLFDPGQLEKVFLNLLSNALKFTPSGGSVTVSITREGHDAVVVVRDTGVGIAASELPHVFERFYQADTSSTRRYDGTGIGLALARELVELHGGSISVSSEPQAGSAFAVRIPLEGIATSPVVSPTGAHQAIRRRFASDGTQALPWSGETLGVVMPEEALVTRTDFVEDRTTVLVVDDNADVRTYVRAILSKTYRVLEAADGQEGLELAQRDLPDLIVADVMMPGMDGLAFGRAVRADALTDAIAVVLLTARAESESQIAGYEAGADAYLTKPFEPAVLEACIAGLLTQRRRLRERYRAGDVALPTADLTSTVAIVPAPLEGADVVLDVDPDVALVDALEPAVTAPDAESGRQSAIAQRLRPIVLERLLDAALTPASLAESAGMSYHQLYRALHSDAGTTPSRFIRSIRTERAAELLQAGSGSVTEVAYAVGFESLSYFSRAFRERFGVSPMAYLTAARGENAHSTSQNTEQ